MKKIKLPKIAFYSSSPALKIVVIVLILFSMAALMALGWVRSGIDRQVTDLKAEAAELEQKNADLREKISNLESAEGIREIAREELGLVDGNTIVIQPE